MVCVCPNFQSVTISHRREKPCHQFHFAKRRSGWGEGGGKEAGRSKKKNLLWIYVGFRWRSLVKQTRKRLHEWLEKERKRMSRIVRMFRVFSLFFWFFSLLVRSLIVSAGWINYRRLELFGFPAAWMAAWMGEGKGGQRREEECCETFTDVMQSSCRFWSSQSVDSDTCHGNESTIHWWMERFNWWYQFLFCFIWLFYIYIYTYLYIFLKSLPVIW